MKSRRTQIISLVAVVITVGAFALAPHQAHASVTSWFYPSIDSIMDSVLTFGFNNVGLPLANMFLQLTGYLLNATMTVTLNMNTLVSSSGGIVDSTWSIIRDLSSILIIFFLLYSSIAIIIGKSDSKVQHLILMVAVAGILINFSLFFTKVAVDASNLVSLAFYRAITPTGSAQWDGTGDYLGIAQDGGLSNVFMNALEIQDVYQPAGNATSDSGAETAANPLSIISAGVGGIVIMIIAALSFLAASILFAVRIGILIILMAFSPVFFVGMIIPQLKPKLSNRWRDALIGQCLIMPVYMLFMYVALRVITNPTFKNVLNPANQAASTGVGIVSAGTVGVVIQYVISIILIFIPLIAAMEYASFGKEWANAAVKKVKGSLGKNTLGRAAYFAQNSKTVAGITSRVPGLGVALQSSLGKVADSGFGGGKKGYASDLKSKEKAYTKAYEKQDDAGKARMRRNLDQTSTLRKTPIIGALFKTAGSNTAQKIGTNIIKSKATKDYNAEKSILEDSKAQNAAERAYITLQVSRGTNDAGKPLTTTEIANFTTRLKELEDDNRIINDELQHVNEQLDKNKVVADSDALTKDDLEALEAKIASSKP